MFTSQVIEVPRCAFECQAETLLLDKVKPPEKSEASAMVAEQATAKDSKLPKCFVLISPAYWHVN
jgi:hypothetical protein